MRLRETGRIAAVALAALAVPACGGGGSQIEYTVHSIRGGFVRPADIGAGATEFEDPIHGSHIVYTPPDSVPTCPYVQRADNVEPGLEAAVELPGGNATGRFIVGQTKPQRHPLPVVTQGAVVFKSDTLAERGMRTVAAVSAKCPKAFTVLGGPAVVIGDYRVVSRPVELAGWKGFAQQLAHTSPPQLQSDTYDDLATVVVQKANAILYVGYAQVKKTGQRADSTAKVEGVMQRALGRLG